MTNIITNLQYHIILIVFSKMRGFSRICELGQNRMVDKISMDSFSQFTHKTIENETKTKTISSASKCRKYFTTSQLARRWDVSSVTVIRLIEQGDLNGLKIRGCYRISKGSIKSYELKVAF